MALAAFQQALCDLIASPALTVAVRSDPVDFLGRYDLSPRERQRLREMVWQRGMSTTCTLYRSNRVTPIYTLLHYTCVMLGDGLKNELDAYWANTELRDLEFKREIDRFSYFLKQRMAAGAITNPFIREILDFELALNELRFAPRRRIVGQLRAASGGEERGPLRPHPLVRVVRFAHEAGEVLKVLASGLVPAGLPALESFLVLSGVGEELCVKDVDTQAARLLWRMQVEDLRCRYSDPGMQQLCDEGLVCIRPAGFDDYQSGSPNREKPGDCDQMGLAGFIQGGSHGAGGRF